MSNVRIQFSLLYLQTSKRRLSKGLVGAVLSSLLLSHVVWSGTAHASEKATQSTAQPKALSTVDLVKRKQHKQKKSHKSNTSALDKARASFIYRAKLNETPEAIAFEFLDQAQLRNIKKKFFKHNRIIQKNTRKPVAQHTPFNIPVAWMYLKPTRASVLSVSGAVQSASDIAEPRAGNITVQTMLAQGARIQTGANGFASIALPDGSVLLIEPNSDVTLDTLKQYASSDIFKINIVLNKGRVESSVKPLTSAESSYTIKSKRLTTGVRGTRFAVSDSADGTGNGLLEVLEGAVVINSPTRGEQSTTVGYGRVVQLADPSPPIELFSKPVWQCNRKAAFSLGSNVSVAVPDATVQLHIDVYAGKQTDVQKQSPFKQQTVTHTSPVIDLNLPSGDYTVVARAVDSYGLKGYSALQTITVKQPTQIAPTISVERADWVRNWDTLSWVWQDKVIINAVAVTTALTAIASDSLVQTHCM